MVEGLTGGCACGAVRYRLLERPIWTHCCHCTWCQRETGSGFAINALIEFDRIVATTGRPAPVHVPSESGNGQRIFRCANCQVALWSIYSAPAILFIRAGTLDEPRLIVPDIHIFISSRLPWVQIPRGARAVPEFYDYAETWPRDSFARREAAIARHAATAAG